MIDLKKLMTKLTEILERWENININDTQKWSNQGAHFTRQLKNMLYLARVITKGALLRNESRGAHYKPDFPERDDENFLKTTMAKFDPANWRTRYHLSRSRRFVNSTT